MNRSEKRSFKSLMWSAALGGDQLAFIFNELSSMVDECDDEDIKPYKLLFEHLKKSASDVCDAMNGLCEIIK